MRPIDADAAIDALKEKVFHNLSDEFYGAMQVLDELPSVQPERKTGRWITDDSELGIKCNKCGKSFSEYINAGTGYMFLEEIPNFCPNCGADMRGEENEIN